MRQCDNCGHLNDATADFCVNQECRTFLGWSTVRTAAAEPVPAPVAPTQPVESEPRPPATQRAGFRLRLDPADVAAEPGGVATVKVVAENTGTRVEQLGIVLHGPAGAFGHAEPAALSVYPAATAEAVVTFRPMRDPRHPAGRAPYTVELRSAIHPDLTASASGTVTVAPFAAVVARLEPVTRGHRAGQQVVVVENRGNAPITVGVDFDDRADAVRFHPAKGGATVAPGARAGVHTRLHAPRGVFGKRSYPFTAVVAPTQGGHPPITLEGVHHQRPRRWWLWVLVLLLLWVFVVPAIDGLASSRFGVDSGEGGGGDSGEDTGGEEGGGDGEEGGEGGEGGEDGGGEEVAPTDPGTGLGDGSGDAVVALRGTPFGATAGAGV